MLGETVGAKVNLMNRAMNHGLVTMANITASADPQAKQAGICVLAKSRRQGHQSENYCNCSYADQPVARL